MKIFGSPRRTQGTNAIPNEAPKWLHRHCGGSVMYTGRSIEGLDDVFSCEKCKQWLDGSEYDVVWPNGEKEYEQALNDPQ